MRKLTTLLIATLLSFNILAQDSKITTGVVAYQQQDYDGAVEAFEVGLKDESSVKAKNLPKGYYYLGKSLIYQFQKAAQEQDNAALDKYGNNLLKAHTAFKNAKKHDDGKWGEKVDKELGLLYNAFLTSAVGALNKATQLQGEQATTAYSETKKYLEICIEIDNSNYLGYDLLGQAELGLKDSTNAIKSFNKAAQAFITNPPSRADLLIGYVYYRIGLLERYMNNDLDKALTAIGQGKEIVEKEWERWQAMLVNLPDEQKQAVTEQYNNAKGDLSRFELDILLNSPSKLGEALVKFEKVAKEEPDNYTMQIAYAQLLENADPEKAIVVYQKAIKINPENSHAYFNLGALYNNIAAKYYNQANELDWEESEPLQQQAIEYMGKAYPNFQKVLEITPDDVATLRALAQLAISLDKVDDYKKYKDQLKVLGY